MDKSRTVENWKARRFGLGRNNAVPHSRAVTDNIDDDFGPVPGSSPSWPCPTQPYQAHSASRTTSELPRPSAKGGGTVPQARQATYSTSRREGDSTRPCMPGKTGSTCEVSTR